MIMMSEAKKSQHKIYLPHLQNEMNEEGKEYSFFKTEIEKLSELSK